MRNTFWLLPLLLFTSPLAGQQERSSFPYDLNRPHQIYLLPEMLEEVSGLTHYAPNQIAALNDEHGRMYVYDISERRIVHKVRFEGSGDFEGIELVGKYIYAIKSNGNMYRFNIEMTGVVEKLEGPFDSDNNIEGLGYNPVTGQLLIALKGESDIKGVDVKGKAIYAFDLTTDKFLKIPVYTLKDKDVERVLGSKYKKIRPSGVAVHPITHEVYVIASTGRALIVFHQNGEPKNLTILKSSLFPQPEGITFSPEGDLFISNEQEGEGGTLLHFKMKKSE